MLSNGTTTENVSGCDVCCSVRNLLLTLVLKYCRAVSTERDSTHVQNRQLVSYQPVKCSVFVVSISLRVLKAVRNASLGTNRQGRKHVFTQIGSVARPLGLGSPPPPHQAGPLWRYRLLLSRGRGGRLRGWNTADWRRLEGLLIGFRWRRLGSVSLWFACKQ